MNLPDPLLQLSFATRLDSARDKVLLKALREAVGSVSVAALDVELAEFAPVEALTKLAAAGIRGETYFPVPLVLRQRPQLLGYYRLLFGYSQKQFYQAGAGATRFKAMEISNRLSSDADSRLPELCHAFANAGSVLVTGLGHAMKSPTYSDDLCLLTLGAQFRGSANNAKGSEGIEAVFAVIKAIFEDETESSEVRSLSLKSASGRSVRIELAADPDILIKSRMDDGNDRIVVAIEVKAGEDHSNIWNRIGEAEKSHLKARERGVAECWTIINDRQAPESQLRTASPSTHRFYQLTDLTNDQSTGHAEFASRVRDMVGL